MRRPYIKRQYRQTWLMDFALSVIKYFSLGLMGCTITYVVAIALDLCPVAAAIEMVMGLVLVRSLLLLGCLWAIAVIHESIR